MLNSLLASFHGEVDRYVEIFYHLVVDLAYVQEYNGGEERGINLSDIATMLECKKWAVVGATDNAEKFGYKIFKFLKDSGMEAVPVNPGVNEILGQVCYPSLKDLPEKPEAVDIVVPPKIGEQIVKDCAELGIQNVWLQPGADTEQVVKTAQQLGLNVVYHACIMVECRNQGGK